MSKNQLSGKLAVILHADIADSTQLVQRNERLAHERIRDAFRRFGETIARYHGRIREVRGDALLAEFERASDAVAAALVFQSEHEAHLAGPGDDIRPAIRVGIALGEVIIADGTVTGAGVVLAQRIEQLADAGGLCVTSAIHEALPRRMPLEFDSLGEQSLKGFDDRVRAFRVRLSSGETIASLRPEKQAQKKVITPARIGALAAIVLVIIGGVFYSLQPKDAQQQATTQEFSTLPVSGKPSVAVLPFVNMSGDPEQEYFSDGMTEDLLTDLSQVSALDVISRTSTFAYKGQTPDVRDVGEALGASHVVEGSVRKAGHRIRITAQLIDARTGEHIWAERYDRDFDDIFDLQDEVRARIVNALSIELAAGEAARFKLHGTESVEAYDLVMQGRFHESSFTRDGTNQAIRLYQRAIEIDPGYAIAYARMANMYDQRSRFGWSDDNDEDLSKAVQLAEKAVSMNDENPFSHWSLGRILSRIKSGGIKNQFEAVASLERAIELDPNYADAYAFISHLYAGVGDTGKGLEAIEKAMKLNPQYPFWYIRNRGIVRYLQEDYDNAIADLQTAVQKNPTAFIPRWWLAAAYAQSGDPDEAEWQIEELKELGFDLTITNLLENSLIFHPPFAENFAEGLRKSGIPE